jgi:signal transduction histidine kinase
LRGNDLRVLAEEQAALRRVATLVARGAAPQEGFAAVVEEVGRLLPVDFADMGRYEPGRTITFVAAWGSGDDQSPVGTRWSLDGKNLATLVFETGCPARIDSYVDASGPLGIGGRERGFRSAVGTPIIVEGRLWGVVIAGSTLEQSMPADTEARLASFTELLATAISNAESRAGLSRLAEEQAALRRVATLVARRVPQEELFAAVSEEVWRLLPVDFAIMGRYEPDGTATPVAAWGAAADRFPPGSRWILDGNNLSTIVFETGRPGRIDNYAEASGPTGVTARETGCRSAVATPILVEGRIWGLMIAGLTVEQLMPADTEARLASFTDLLATAIANADSRTELGRLAEEQAALRRVATLVAHGAPPDGVFAAVVEEVMHLLPVEYAHMGRYEFDDAVTIVTSLSRTGPFFPVGGRWMLGGNNLATLVHETGRPARVDGADASGPIGVAIRERGRRSAVGTPVFVESRLWGVMIAGSTLAQPLPADAEARLASFTELLATAIANAESRAALAASRARIVAAGDEMRRRIERDLHDGAQQRLVSLALELRAVQADVPPDLGELKGELSHVAEGLASVFDELREISHGIHPAILSDKGLEPALRALVRRSAVPVELDLHAAERRLPEQVEVAAYYVVSEALTNAAKHAHASVVNIELGVHNASVRLAIRDDGIGGADPGRGSGLVGLGDRIEALGGTLQVTSATGSGTTLLIQIPTESQSHSGSPRP